MKVLFIAPPFSGHLNPLLPLARRAREAGHDCLFFTGVAKAGQLRAQGFPVIVPRSIPADGMERIANWHRQTASSPLEPIRQLSANLGILAPLGAEVGTALDEVRPDVAVVDFIAAVSARQVSARSIPWITTIPTPFAIENRRGVPAYLGGWTPMPGPLGRVRDAAGRLAVTGFKRTVFRLLASRLKPLLPRLYREDGSEAGYSNQKILGFGLRELEFERDWPAAFEMIGPVTGEPESAPPLDLPLDKPCVLASVGTHLLWAKERLVADVAEIARALPGWHFVVSLGRPGDTSEARHVLDNVTVVPFVPYARELARFDVVIHHGGAGVTYAAIAAGVPSLVVPHDYDQFDFAARIAWHGIGIRMKSLSDRGAPDALRRLARRGDWPNLALMQQASRRYDPPARFLAALEEVRDRADRAGAR
jgi:UDP:flavonoid glycosyltransferase YjiC (YdhE family)